MKPLRPAWVTILIIGVFLVLTVLGWLTNGIFALIPLAFAFAFFYDLSHHSTNRRVVFTTRIIAILGLVAVIAVAVTEKAVGAANF
jgi:hypothetical protein